MSNLGDVLRQVVCVPSHIPNDWLFLKLTDICNPKQWRTIASNEMSTSGYPVFGANGFVGFYHEYNHEDETVAITCRGNTCGTINRIPPKTYITGNSMALDDIKSDLVSQNYLFYALKYRGVVDSISGSAQPQITGAGLKFIEFPAPPLPEQQKIAAILSSVDEVIEKTRAQIDKLKDLKTGMRQELLTKGVGHTEFKDSPVGRIPVGWDVVPLEKLVKAGKNITYGIVQAGPHYEGGVPYIRVSDMTGRSLSRNGMLLTSPEIAEKYERSAVSSGDIVYALRGVIGHVQIVPKDLDGANLTQGTARVSPNELVDTRYLLWAMKSPYVEYQNDLEAKGSTFREVTLASLRKIQIATPELNEQKRIASILGSVELKIFAVEDKLVHLESIKKALMQDLLTGKVRVNVEQKETAVA
ncbi:Type I restriction-modification system2C specificity subunit S [gamma proteobacterium IMCC2047]|nr:Type I restriction-modification system2C specificity subunit S [gamma proteobacterium IMCC2047]